MLERIRAINEVMDQLKEIVENREIEFSSISSLENGHLQRFFIGEVRSMNRMEFVIPRIEKYIKHFEKEILMLSSPKEHHMFTHQNLHDELFKQWGKYD
jgi:hypothetical protein